jgi:hypothetical protein
MVFAVLKIGTYRKSVQNDEITSIGLAVLIGESCE